MINRYASKYRQMQKGVLESVLGKEMKKKEASVRLEVSRVTLDKWINRYKRYGEEGLERKKRKKYPKAHNRTSQEQEKQVVELAEEYWYDGVEILSDRLWERHKISLNPSTIYRILKRRGVRYNESWNGTKKRRKKQLYCHGEAGKELQVDTKYPFGYKEGKVIYTAIDDASRWSYAKAYITANAANSCDFLTEVHKRFPIDIQKIRTDCGTEFVNKKVQASLKQQGISHRTNTPYCPEENGKIERFHRTLNEKLISVFLSPKDSLQQINFSLVLWLYWYNHHKRHRGLGMNGLTPSQKLFLLASKNVNLTLQCNNA